MESSKSLTFDRGETPIVHHTIKEIHVYRVTEDQIDKLSHGAGTTELACLTSTASTSIAFGIAFITRIENDFTKSIFGVFAFCLLLMAAYFYNRWKIYLHDHKNSVDEIKNMPVSENDNNTP